MIHGEPVYGQGTRDRMMNTTRIVSILALFVASFTACASRGDSPITGTSARTTAAAPRRAACTLASNSWLCNPIGFSIGTVILTGPQEISIPSGVEGQFFTIRLTQDSAGGHVPTWTSIFLFQALSANSASTLVPLSFPNASENILFQYDTALDKWVYLSRSGIQQISPTIQGAGTTISDPPVPAP